MSDARIEKFFSGINLVTERCSFCMFGGGGCINKNALSSLHYAQIDQKFLAINSQTILAGCSLGGIFIRTYSYLASNINVKGIKNTNFPKRKCRRHPPKID